MHKIHGLTGRWSAEFLSEWIQRIANQQLFQQKLGQPLQQDSSLVCCKIPIQASESCSNNLSGNGKTWSFKLFKQNFNITIILIKLRIF